MAECTVYIDEAGDLGINRGTQWFVLTAVIVKKEHESKIRSKMNEIKNKLNIREIHLRRINDFYKRAYIVRELNDEEFVYMNVLVDTKQLDPAKLPDAAITYNYMCKYLLQRVSWYLEEHKLIGDIVLSARGTSRDGELIAYINEKLLPFAYNQINPSCFDKVSAKTAGQWDLLQLADVCATTMFYTYEINGFSFCVPCFSETLSLHLYCRNGKVDSYGVKFFRNEMKPDIVELRKHRICAKKERIPGATST